MVKKIILLFSGSVSTGEKDFFTALHSLQYRIVLALCLPEPLGAGGPRQLLQRNVQFPVTKLASVETQFEYFQVRLGYRPSLRRREEDDQHWSPSRPTPVLS